MNGPNPNALRTRRWRQRVARGGRIYSVELDDETVERLVAKGIIDRSDLTDSDDLAIRLGEFIEENL